MKHLLTILVFHAAAGLLRADDWPAWRGASGQGYCTEKNLPLRWSDKDNVKWKIALPHPGNSTPIIWKDRIFLTVANKGGSVRSLMCFDRKDGKQLWKNDVAYDFKERNWTPDWYANASPATDGERVVVSFGSAGMYCYDLDGKELWKRTDLGKWAHAFGNASSPVLYQELCILWCGPNEGGPRGNSLLAVGKMTGKTVWETTEKFSSWGTPVIVKIDGKDQLLYCPAYKLKSVDPRSGKELWHCDGLMEYVYTSPLYSPKHKIAVAMSGYNKSALAVKVGGKGDITRDRLWHHPKNIQRVGSGIIIGDHVYILEENGTPRCYELETGKELWKVEKRPAGTNWGSMVHVDGKLYVFTRDGSTVVFNASPKYELLATNRLGDGESTNSSPAISNGEIFLRTNRHLWCIAER
ncbi:MAG: serine/threonine protein kinase [Planctomycetes bacterium]|nr:serine/threonine protein kinase [Planctomycetota bacterium]